MREKDRGRVTCFLLQLTDKEAMVAVPQTQQKINERQDEQERQMRCEGSGKGLVDAQREDEEQKSREDRIEKQARYAEKKKTVIMTMMIIMILSAHGSLLLHHAKYPIKRAYTWSICSDSTKRLPNTFFLHFFPYNQCCHANHCFKGAQFNKCMPVICNLPCTQYPVVRCAYTTG